MDKIDPTLTQAMLDKPETKLEVLITCTSDHAPVVAQLETLGSPAGRGLLALKILTARLTASQINKLSAHPSVEGIALDDDATHQ